MINVNGIKRNAKNIVKKYSDAQVKVREATSNDPWGPSSTIMAEIADLTYNVVAFSEIMQMIWKRLNDHGKNWRHVYKALVLLEYLIKTGTEKVAQQCVENIFAIQTLKDFQYMEDSKDYGMNIREKSKKMVALLKDSEKLKAERARALKAKARLAEAMSSVDKNSLSTMMSASMNGDSSMLPSNLQLDVGTSSSAHSRDGAVLSAPGTNLDAERPQTLTEEENQLQLALALSKEEAEQQEKTRKHDELRLKLALGVSKAASGTIATTPTATGLNLLEDFADPCESSPQMSITDPVPINQNASSGHSQSKSAIDDLLGLSIPPPPSCETTPKVPISSMMNSQPITKPLDSSTLIVNPVESIFSEPQDDPWAVGPWQTTRATQSSHYTASLAAQQRPTNYNLATGGGISTVPKTTSAPMMTPKLSSATFPTLSESNGFMINNNGASSVKPLSKNPFQD